MARQTKAKTTETTEKVTTTTTTTASTPVVMETATKEKKTKTTKAAKVETTPVVAETPVVVVEEQPTTSDGETPLVEQSVEFSARLNQLSVAISALKTDYRALEKKWSRELKLAQKQSSKRKRKEAWNPKFLDSSSTLGGGL